MASELHLLFIKWIFNVDMVDVCVYNCTIRQLLETKQWLLSLHTPILGMVGHEFHVNYWWNLASPTRSPHSHFSVASLCILRKIVICLPLWMHIEQQAKISNSKAFIPIKDRKFDPTTIITTLKKAKAPRGLFAK